MPLNTGTRLGSYEILGAGWHGQRLRPARRASERGWAMQALMNANLAHGAVNRWR